MSVYDIFIVLFLGEIVFLRSPLFSLFFSRFGHATMLRCGSCLSRLSAASAVFLRCLLFESYQVSVSGNKDLYAACYGAKASSQVRWGKGERVRELRGGSLFILVQPHWPKGPVNQRAAAGDTTFHLFGKYGHS